jgi:predicted RNA binding protein YcfA (HicA-like mRNA interferase family)
MKAREIIKRITQLGGTEIRQHGSHRIFKISDTITISIPDHGSKDLGTGLVRSIERQLEPIYGKRWLR